ncbi:MAG: hypothetical protein ACK5MT_20310 [Actinomycetales bacterium]
MRPSPGARARSRLRALVNTTNLSTPVGLLLAAIGGATIRRGPRRLLLAEGYRWPFPTGVAFTVGNVVLTRRQFVGADRAGPGQRGGVPLPDQMLDHEDVHAWQWAALGPAFLPSYLLALAWSWYRTGNLGTANVFERQAGLAAGGYPTGLPRRHRPQRPG